MKKRNLYSVIILLVLISGIISIGGALVNKNIAWEQASHIKAKINNVERNLQDPTKFVNDILSPSSVLVASPVIGHDAGEIWVSVKGSEMTLKDALASTSLCGTPLVGKFLFK